MIRLPPFHRLPPRPLARRAPPGWPASRTVSDTERNRLIDEVTATIVEEAGTEPKRFIYPAQQPAVEHAEWHSFAYAYDRAFKNLWDACLAETRRYRRSSLLSHLLFLCRQSIELWLKAALAAFDPSEPPPDGYDLRRLWRALLSALDDAGDPRTTPSPPPWRTPSRPSESTTPAATGSATRPLVHPSPIPQPPQTSKTHSRCATASPPIAKRSTP